MIFHHRSILAFDYKYLATACSVGEASANASSDILDVNHVCLCKII